MGHVRLVHCDSNGCKFKGVSMVSSYKRKVPMDARKGCNIFLGHYWNSYDEAQLLASLPSNSSSEVQLLDNFLDTIFLEDYLLLSCFCYRSGLRDHSSFNPTYHCCLGLN